MEGGGSDKQPVSIQKTMSRGQNEVLLLKSFFVKIRIVP